MVPPLFDSWAPLPVSTIDTDPPAGNRTPDRASAALFLSTMVQPVRSTDDTVVLPITTTSLPGSSPAGFTSARSMYTAGNAGCGSPGSVGGGVSTGVVTGGISLETPGMR